MKALSIILAALFTLASPAAQAAPKKQVMEYYKEMAAKAAKDSSLNKDIDARDCDPDHGDRKSCVSAICEKGGINCGFQSGVEKAAGLCRGRIEGECIDSLCAKGAINCGFESGLTKVAELCKNANGRCVEVACAAGAITATSAATAAAARPRVLRMRDIELSL